MAENGLDVGRLAERAGAFREKLRGIKSSGANASIRWYPYDSLGNLAQLSSLLSGRNRDLLALLDGRPALDIGSADGDLAFLLEESGAEVDVIEHAPTNMNALAGLKAMKAALRSNVSLLEADLDAQFRLPRKDYGLAFFLGTLYHLKNPFYALEALSHSARRCLLSARIAKFTPDKKFRMAEYPVAYLADRLECNGDPTNFWIFSEAGLKRLLDRSGWRIAEFMTVGETQASDPAHGDADERAYCLIESLRA